MTAAEGKTRLYELAETPEARRLSQASRRKNRDGLSGSEIRTHTVSFWPQAFAMLLVLDVGNTNTVLGVFAKAAKDDGSGSHHDERIVANWRVATVATQTVDEYGVLFRNLFAMDKIEVTGISPGAQVITQRPDALQDGSVVSVVGSQGGPAPSSSRTSQ